MASLFFHNFTSKTMTLSVITLLLLFSLNHTFFVHAIPESELEDMLSALRSKGYNLFGNAITTSDLRFDILVGTQFTFFSPTDSALFALDMKATASDYLNSLSLHIVPRRLSSTDLRSLTTSRSHPPILRTLLPNRSLRISSRRSPESYVVSVNGVDVAVAGLFYGRHVAVHGLDGILSLRSSVGSRRSPPREGLPPRMSGGDVSTDGDFVRPDYDESYVDGISPVGQDLGLVPAPEVQPPVIRLPDLMSPRYGFPVPETYGLRSPVEAPQLQASAEYLFPEIPSTEEVPVVESGSGDGYERGKRLEVIVGEMATGLSWFSGGKAEV